MYVCIVCMYVCMYACMHACMYVCMHACHACMYVYMYVCMYVCMHACMYALTQGTARSARGTFNGPRRCTACDLALAPQFYEHVLDALEADNGLETRRAASYSLGKHAQAGGAAVAVLDPHKIRYRANYLQGKKFEFSIQKLSNLLSFAP